MLAEDMTRLCGEIVTLRKGRGSLLNELVHGNRDRKQSMGEFTAEAHTARSRMARRTRNERMAFLHTLSHGVAAARREMRMDLAGARRAWAGKTA